MEEILKSTLGFAGVLLVGLLGVLVSSFLKLGDSNTLMTTIDNVSRLR